MNIQKKHDRLIAMLKQIAPDGDLDSIDVDPSPLLESTKSGMPSADLDLQVERACLLYTSPSPRDATLSRMPSSA